MHYHIGHFITLLSTKRKQAAFFVMATKNTCFFKQEGVTNFEPMDGRILVDVAKNVCMSVEKHGHDIEN